MRPTRSLFLLALPLLAACGGSVTVVLKSPVESKCSSQGLKGCPELTDGVLLYVQGEKEKGKDKLVEGAAQNAPGKVRKFAQAIRELKKIPGTAAYTKTLMEVADILATAKGSGGGGDEAGGSAEGSMGSAEDAAMYGNRGGNADERGVATPATARGRGPCGRLGGYDTCVTVLPGPFVLTDLSMSPGCPAGMAVTTDSTRWVVRNPHGLGGEKGFVRSGESLVVAVQGADPHCSVNWAGYRPIIAR